MNKKGYSKGYASGFARILDAVAGDQVPHDLDLAPNILTRIQNKRGNRMLFRTRFVYTTILVVLVLVVLLVTVPGMAAAIGRWFGYVPGVGLVREGHIRALASPVSVTREGVTLTVEQVVLDPERTVLVYTVEGVPLSAFITDPREQCPYTAALRLPDGSIRAAGPGGGPAWQTGYQHRFTYPPVPAAVNDATLLVSCLFNTRSGSAPENWEIPLRFAPAPPHLTAFPVIEIPTPTAPAAMPEASPNATPAQSATVAASPQPVSMTLTLDRAVQMDDGYLIYATLNWQDTPFSMVEVTDVQERLHLLDAAGQEMLYEVRDDEQTGPRFAQRQTVFAIKTAPVQVPGPLTLRLDAVSIETAVKASFPFDPGPNPAAGQTWTINQEVAIGAHRLRVRSATAVEDGFTFEMSSDTGIGRAMLTDLDHPLAGGGGGGSSLSTVFSASIHYAAGLPGGPLTITITTIGLKYTQRLEAQWTPPAASADLLPTQPAACLTTASWKAARVQKPPLPDGVTGRVLTGGPLDNPPSGRWGVTITILDGLTQRVIEGAQDGSPSPDGARLAYSVVGGGISVMDLATGQVDPLPGTANGDFNPIWSPDGQQIVFNRGMSIFDLFIVKPDGTDMRQLTHGGVQEWPVGWLPDGHLLYTVPGRENEYTNYQVDVQSGESQLYSQDSPQSISPDGKYIITIEKTFGDRWMTYISRVDGSDRWLLADSGLWVLTPIWSPDGAWLLAGVSNTDSGSTIGGLVNLRTCQVIPLPAVKGNLLGWVR